MALAVRGPCQAARVAEERAVVSSLCLYPFQYWAFSNSLMCQENWGSHVPRHCCREARSMEPIALPHIGCVKAQMWHHLKTPNIPSNGSSSMGNALMWPGLAFIMPIKLAIPPTGWNSGAWY